MTGVTFDTKAEAEAYNPATAPDTIVLRGYASAGDGGGALYKKVASEPSHAGKLQIAEGTWYELAEFDAINPIMFGANGDGSTDDHSAIADLITYLDALYDSGTQYGITVELLGRLYAMSDTTVIDNKFNYVTIQNGGFKAIGSAGSWAESRTTIANFFDNYETLTADYGSDTFELRKPLFDIAEFNPGFTFQHVDFECDDLSAGVYVYGNAKERTMENCEVNDFLTYGIFQHESGPDNGNYSATILLNFCKIRGNNSAEPRQGYGIVYDGTDCHYVGTTAQWCHCPLLTTGATLYMADCDLFNGSNDSENPVTSRLWEHHGNTITWIGGRLGNGQIHVWNTDLTIQPTKHGYTQTNDGDAVFVFRSSGVDNKEITNLLYYPAEIPVELRNGTVKLIDLKNGAGFPGGTSGGSWAPTAFQVESLVGYIMMMPETLKLVAGAANDTVLRLVSLEEKCRLQFENDGNDTSGRPWVGSNGLNLILGTGDTTERWEVVNNGVMRPVTAGHNLGSNAHRVGTIYLENSPDISSDRRLKEDIQDIPAADKRAARVIQSQVKRFKTKDGDGRWRYGVIAQDVLAALEAEGIAPQDVGFINMNADDGGMLSISYDDLQMLLLAQ